MQLLAHRQVAAAQRDRSVADVRTTPLVVALHGFTHDGATWTSVARRVAGADVVAIDLPGHGSSRGVAAASLDDAAAAVCATARCLAGARPLHLVGYSLGGRIAMHAAIAAPSMWTSVTIVSASPGISDPSERAQRARDDELAAGVLAADPEKFLREWESLPLFAGLADDARGELAAIRRANDPRALADALVAFSVGRQRDLREALAALAVPVHCVAGARDERYAALAREIAAARNAAGTPVSVTVAVDVGHVVHLEAPGVVAAVVAAATS